MSIYNKFNNMATVNSKQRLFEVMSKVDKTFKLNESVDNMNVKPLDEAGRNEANKNYTHFAVLKNIAPEVDGQIVNGWDYRGYDPTELRQFKKDYFFNDMADNQINPKNINVVTSKYLQRSGINPFSFDFWFLPQKPENQKYVDLIYTV